MITDKNKTRRADSSGLVSFHANQGFNFLQHTCQVRERRRTCFRLIAREISEKKQAETVLQESERFYRRMVEAANLGIWIIDSENRTRFVNPKMAKRLRCSADEIIGKPIVSFMDAKGITLAEAQREAIRRGIEESQDYKLRRQDGAELWVRLSTSPLFDEQEQFIGTLVMVMECAGLKRRIGLAEQWVGVR